MATVRRPGSSIYDRIGTYDMTTDETYRERGINLLHGYLSERYVDKAEYIGRVPEVLAGVGVLLEPTSIAEKGIAQAYEIQRRLKVWQPERAAVIGGGDAGAAGDPDPAAAGPAGDDRWPAPGRRTRTASWSRLSGHGT